MAEKTKSKREVNQTAVVAGGIIVTGTVLLALIDGGFTNMVFQAITGTTGYFIHNLAVNDLPEELRDEAREIIISNKALMTGSSVLAGIGVAADPIIGGVLLCLAIGAHYYLDELRRKEIEDIDKAMKESVKQLGGAVYG